MRRRAVFVISEDWYYWSHRRPLARALVERGYDVTLVTQVGSLRDQIESERVQVRDLPLIRGSLNVFNDLSYLRSLMSIYRELRPDIAYHVASKPVLYGSFAAWRYRVPRVVNALAGLGYLFSNNSLRIRVVRGVTMAAYRFLLNRENAALILQNKDDYARLKKALRLTDGSIALIRGAGVNVEEFSPALRDNGRVPVITHISRLIREKGVEDLVAAARELRKRGLEFRVWVVGDVDEKNPNSITTREMEAWQDEGVIEWLGRRENINELYSESDIAVLASYYKEGLPKSLLEACACGLPIVTTDNAGCLEVVEHQRNGLIVPMRDVAALADALAALIQDVGLRLKLGEAGRHRAETEFSEETVVAQTLSVFGVESEPVRHEVGV